MAILDLRCEGKLACTNRVEKSMGEVRRLHAASKPFLCQECFNIYGGMNSARLDEVDPWPRESGTRVRGRI